LVLNKPHGAAFANLTQIQVASDGRLYATWAEVVQEPFGAPENKVYLQAVNEDFTLDGGNVLVTSSIDSPAFDDPSIATFGSTVYVGFISGSPSGAWDVRVAASTDSGKTFAPSVKANDDETCATHFHHQLAVDGTGRVHVLYYDNRYLTGNVMHAFSAAADAGGLAFGAGTFVNSKSFPFTTDRDSLAWLGDYLGFSAVGSKMYAVWSDPRADRSQIFFSKGAME
jgi:hypothetical protein